MKRSFFILLWLFLLLLLQLTCYTQALQTVYDGRADPKTNTPLNGDVQLIRRYALPKARQAWRDDKTCTEEFEAIDVTSGSFTRANSQQRAILYRFCVGGHDFANNGIVIIENGKIVAHVVYFGGEDSSITSLPDLNGDGLSEIGVFNSTCHQGICQSLMQVLEVTPASVKYYGIADVDYDDCGSKPRGCKTLAYKITVKPSATPIFYRETYTQNKNGRWTITGAPVKYSLREHDRGQFKPLMDTSIAEPYPTPESVPKTISGGVLNGKATSLPQPAYPAMARQQRISGQVNVQVLIDENGNVVSAQAVSGQPLLRTAAVAAAYEAKFPPTMLSGQPVKVSGLIVYDFVLQ